MHVYENSQLTSSIACGFSLCFSPKNCRRLLVRFLHLTFCHHPRNINIITTTIINSSKSISNNNCSSNNNRIINISKNCNYSNSSSIIIINNNSICRCNISKHINPKSIRTIIQRCRCSNHKATSSIIHISFPFAKTANPATTTTPARPALCSRHCNSTPLIPSIYFRTLYFRLSLQHRTILLCPLRKTTTQLPPMLPRML